MMDPLFRKHYMLDAMASQNHQPYDCLLKRLVGGRSQTTSKLRVTGLCVGNSPVTGEFPAQRASNAKMFPFDDVIMKGAAMMSGKEPPLEGNADWLDDIYFQNTTRHVLNMNTIS